jgi:hypothetical protein
VQRLTLDQNIPVVEQTPMSGQDSPVYASRSSPLPVQRQQSTEAPNNSNFPAPIPVGFPVNVVWPSQLPEQVHRASPVPPQIPQPVETRQVSIPLEKARRDTSHSNFVHSPQSSEPGASQGGSFGPRSNGQAPSLTQFSKSKESLRQESNAVSLYSASPSSLPQSPQFFDRARLGGSATSLSPASPSNFPRLPQPLDQDDCRDKASPLPPVPASNFPRDRDSEGIRIAHHHPSPSLPVKPTTRPLPTSTASDSTQTAHGFTLSPAQTVPPAKSQTRPEPPIHSFSVPLPPDQVIPADQEQRATKVRESNLTGAKMKATAAKFAKNKYVRAGAKIGARVAISQVSNNLIGMDVSGVVDGVGQVANVANAIGGAMSSSGVDLSDVAGGSGGDSGDGNGVVDQVIGAMQNPSVQIQVDMSGDWSSPQNRANRPNMFSASRFMNRKHSGS